MKAKICQNCIHWLNGGENLMLISRCLLGNVVGACWYDYSCSDFEEGVKKNENPLKIIKELKYGECIHGENLAKCNECNPFN